MYLMNAVPMTLENQQWVMCPEFEAGKMIAQAVYAPSPEEALEMIREIHKAQFGEPAHASFAEIRLATDADLPWNSPNNPAFIVESEKGEPLYFGSEEDTRETYNSLLQGKPFTMRPATAAEKEASIRRSELESDKDDEEQFAYGFDVLYPQMRDEGLL
jgi:hypothetical protein